MEALLHKEKLALGKLRDGEMMPVGRLALPWKKGIPEGLARLLRAKLDVALSFNDCT